MIASEEFLNTFLYRKLKLLLKIAWMIEFLYKNIYKKHFFYCLVNAYFFK